MSSFPRHSWRSCKWIVKEKNVKPKLIGNSDYQIPHPTINNGIEPDYQVMTFQQLHWIFKHQIMLVLKIHFSQLRLVCCDHELNIICFSQLSQNMFQHKGAKGDPRPIKGWSDIDYWSPPYSTKFSSWGFAHEGAGKLALNKHVIQLYSTFHPRYHNSQLASTT